MLVVRWVLILMSAVLSTAMLDIVDTYTYRVVSLREDDETWQTAETWTLRQVVASAIGDGVASNDAVIALTGRMVVETTCTPRHNSRFGEFAECVARHRDRKTPGDSISLAERDVGGMFDQLVQLDGWNLASALLLVFKSANSHDFVTATSIVVAYRLSVAEAECAIAEVRGIPSAAPTATGSTSMQSVCRAAARQKRKVQRSEAVPTTLSDVVAALTEQRVPSSVVHFVENTTACVLERVPTLNGSSIEQWLQSRGRTTALSLGSVCDVGAHVVFAALNGTAFSLRPVQVSTAMLLLESLFNAGEANRGRLVELAPGEGKGMTLVMFAIMARLLLGARADIVTFNDALASGDEARHRSLIRTFRLTSCSMPQATCAHRTDERYGTALQFSAQHLQAATDPNSTFDRSKQLVIVDEVDSLLVDGGLKKHSTRLGDKQPGNRYMSAVFPFLYNLARHEISRLNWTTSDTEVTVVEEDANTEGGGVVHRHALCFRNMSDWVEFFVHSHVDGVRAALRPTVDTTSTKLASPRLLIPSHLANYVDSQVPQWLRSAASTVLHPSRYQDYLARSRHIDVLDVSTGSLIEKQQYAGGRHQFLELHNQFPVTPPSITTSVMSWIAFFQQYACIAGVTGTLGSEAEREMVGVFYNVSSVNMPTHLPRLLAEYPARRRPDGASYEELLVGSVREEQSAGRAVLVLCETVEGAMRVEQYLRKAGIAFTLYTISDDEAQRLAMERMLLNNKSVVIATNLGGRGTDYKVTAGVLEAGGLHVIFTFLPPSIRNILQGFGRGPRNGAPGSGQLLLIDSSHMSISEFAQTSRGDKAVSDMVARANGINAHSHLFARFYAMVRAASKPEDVARLKHCWGLFTGEHEDNIRDIQHGSDADDLFNVFDEFLSSCPENIFNHFRKLASRPPTTPLDADPVAKANPVLAYSLYYQACTNSFGAWPMAQEHRKHSCIKYCSLASEGMSVLLEHYDGVQLVAQLGTNLSSGIVDQIDARRHIVRGLLNSTLSAADVCRHALGRNVDVVIREGLVFPKASVNSSIEDEFRQEGVYGTFTVVERPPPPPKLGWWQRTVGRVITAVFQICSGVVLHTLGFVDIGSMLIAEGVSDLLVILRNTAGKETVDWAAHYSEKGKRMAGSVFTTVKASLKSVFDHKSLRPLVELGRKASKDLAKAFKPFADHFQSLGHLLRDTSKNFRGRLSQEFDALTSVLEARKKEFLSHAKHNTFGRVKDAIGLHDDKHLHDVVLLRASGASDAEALEMFERSVGAPLTPADRRAFAAFLKDVAQALTCEVDVKQLSEASFGSRCSGLDLAAHLGLPPAPTLDDLSRCAAAVQGIPMRCAIARNVARDVVARARSSCSFTVTSALDVEVGNASTRMMDAVKDGLNTSTLQRLNALMDWKGNNTNHAQIAQTVQSLFRQDVVSGAYDAALERLLILTYVSEIRAEYGQNGSGILVGAFGEAVEKHASTPKSALARSVARLRAAVLQHTTAQWALTAQDVSSVIDSWRRLWQEAVATLGDLPRGLHGSCYRSGLVEAGLLSINSSAASCQAPCQEGCVASARNCSARLRAIERLLPSFKAHVAEEGSRMAGDVAAASLVNAIGYGMAEMEVGALFTKIITPVVTQHPSHAEDVHDGLAASASSDCQEGLPAVAFSAPSRFLFCSSKQSMLLPLDVEGCARVSKSQNGAFEFSAAPASAVVSAQVHRRLWVKDAPLMEIHDQLFWSQMFDLCASNESDEDEL